jgi:hypothetical protein
MPRTLGTYKNPFMPKPIEGETFIYPNNLVGSYVDHLQIKTYKYINLSQYFVTNNVMPITTIAATNGSGADGRVNAPLVVGEDNGGKGSAVDRFIVGNTINTFKLPMPDSIQFDDTVMWNLEDLRTIGKFAPTIAEQFAKGGDQKDTAATLSALAQSGVPEGIIGIIEGLNVFSSGQAITQGFAGKILNPYHEQIFKGIDPRSFAAKYKLVPRNLKEQNEIYNIIKKLRSNALPNYSRQGLTNEPDKNVNNQLATLGDRWLTTPNIFDLKFITTSSEMTYLPKLKPMVLTNISTNYTPDGAWVTHLDELGQPAPAAVDLTLSFHETEIITAIECEQGY